ncbi:protein PHOTOPERIODIC CONTROL OF HYPOCOTYL 1-like [Primulina tabacum]|uniref:protein PHOTOPERIODIC CONTROL OF HYPOCOTYL 1-like n=1 Tax=Primulina tabacum TaxID=48773 RepID=UPI003F5977B0
MRICTTVDYVLDPGASRPRFGHAIHGLRITKKTDVNLENDIFRSTRILSDTPCDLCSLSPFYGQGKRGLKIKSLSNFTNSESKGNYVKDSEVTAKNALVQEKDPLSGSTSTPSMKGINMDCNSSRQTSVAFSAHAKFKRPNTELPDLNLDLRPLPATVTSSENGDPPSSRTQSLEMDLLLTHAKQPKHPSSPSLDDSPVANPGNRRVKRLKLSSLHSAQGTKSSSKDETSFQEKLNDNFGSIRGSAVISSEKPTFRKPQGKDQYLSVNPSEKDPGLLLSHAWIQRWQHNGSSSTKNESSAKMFCDPQSSNLTLKGLQNKQFPSIAAMALMGRAMSVFQPCELQKRGSLTVWNAKASQKHG